MPSTVHVAPARCLVTSGSINAWKGKINTVKIECSAHDNADRSNTGLPQDVNINRKARHFRNILDNLPLPSPRTPRKGTTAIM